MPGIGAESLSRLPEPDALAALERVAGERFGLPDAAAIAAVPGTAVAVSLLAGSGRGSGPVAIVSPTYGGHARACRAAGRAVVECPTLDAAEASGAGMLLLCRPNNPDGRIEAAAAILACAARLASRGGLVVVDEAFADLEPCGAELAPVLPASGLVLTRSFGKAWGLPGLRLGFVAGPAAVVDPVRAALGAWPVSGPALAIGAAALADREWLGATGARLDRAGAALDALLGRHGFAPRGATRLFLLVAHAEAASRAEALGRAGILVRAWPERPGLLRFGVAPDAAALDRVARALDDKALERTGLGE